MIPPLVIPTPIAATRPPSPNELLESTMQGLHTKKGVVVLIRVSFRVLFRRARYYIGDQKLGP